MAAAVPIEAPKTFVFCPPPPGKPDPKEKYPGDGRIDTRSRVVQKPSSLDCWYYIFNMMRDRIGKHPKCQRLEKRKFEKIASRRKKEYIPLFQSYLRLEHPQQKLLFQNVTTQGPFQVRSTDLDYENYKVFMRNGNCPNFYEFLKEKLTKEMVRINEEFCREVHADPVLYYNRTCVLQPALKDHLQGKKWDKLLPQDKLIVFDNIVRQIFAERYGLKISSWQPDQSIDDLITEISSHGPLNVSGFFSQAEFSVPARPYEHKMIENRKIYGWNENDPRNTNFSCMHSILLVGAEKTGAKKGRVFFIDPADGSDPKDPSSQKIYAISYERLITHCMDLTGFFSEGRPQEVGHAYFSPRLNPNSRFPGVNVPDPGEPNPEEVERIENTPVVQAKRGLKDHGSSSTD